jgi:glycosyltransferase involved in cell wall biosynthesis
MSSKPSRRPSNASRPSPVQTISVVVPVFNEASNVVALVERMTALRRAIPCYDLDVLFVDDHSVDETPALLRRACAAEAGVRYIRLSRNSGSHLAILAGLEHARGDCAVFLAADLQDPPELIPRLLDAWQKGYHTVWAVREERDDIGRVELAASRAFYWLLNRFGMVNIPPQGSDFALLDRMVVRALLDSAGTTPSLGGEIARLGFRQTTIPYRKGRRHTGVSKWTFERKVSASIDAFVAFSYVPLRFMAYVGIVCSVLGFMYAGVVVFLRVFSSRPIQGWASLIVVMLVMGGLQMIMLGVLGEYLWRTLEAARRRPRSFIEEGPAECREPRGDD